jgi:hypothetical protein
MTLVVGAIDPNRKCIDEYIFLQHRAWPEVYGSPQIVKENAHAYG